MLRCKSILGCLSSATKSLGYYKQSFHGKAVKRQIQYYKNKASYASCTASTLNPKETDRKINIIGLTKEELRQEFKLFKIEQYRVDQIWQWLYVKGVQEFDEMLNIKKDLRDALKDKYIIDYGNISKDLIGSDGTRKWLLEFGGEEIESVFIPESRRGTLCVSSQVGCSMSCTFCHTGTQSLVRNLTATEIIGQLMTAKKAMYDFPTRQERVISNIVFMGQGEPFYNYRNVKKALDIMNDESGISISRRRITVSTSGIVPIIKKLGQDFPGCNLAISLHAVTDELRDVIVPANKQWPISELIAACKEFPKLSNNRKVAFEYVMLKDINDSMADARKLVNLIRGFPSVVNIIPFNPWPGSIYECSTEKRILEFAKYIESQGINAPIRWPRGRDILAACGQLRTESTKAKKGESTST